MLSKLCKYEFQATARFFGLAYVAVIVMSVVVGTCLQIPDFQGGVVITFLYGMVNVAVMVAVMVQIVVRFYQNLLKGEGYLMNTLPVHTWQLITSKLLVSLVQIVCSLIVGCLAGGIIYVLFLGVDGLGEQFAELMRILPQINESFAAQNGMGLVSYILLAVLEALLSFAAAILMIYAAMAVGQLVNNHRALASVGAFIGFAIVQSRVESVILSRAVTNSLSLSGTYEGATAVMTVSGRPAAGILLSMLLTVSFGVIFFVVAEELLRRKLNLQ